MNKPENTASQANKQNPIAESGENEGSLDESVHPLSIEALRQGEFPGSDITIEEKLEPGSNYDRYLTSYKSDGLKIYALLTIPQGEKPASGWPVIIFNHGYIPPAEYRTTERYIAYTDAFSRNGYVLFRPDYRGHGSSEGDAPGGYGSNAYTIDVMNAVESVKKLQDPKIGSGNVIDVDRIGMWGHITLRNMVVRNDIKAGVLWAGVVASYPELLHNWRRGTITPSISQSVRRWRQMLVEQYGTPESNPTFWNAISATTYLKDISGPVQIHHGTNDISVPVEFSQKLDKLVKEAGKDSELYVYEGDDHNLANNLGVALDRSVAYFDKYLKN